MFLFLRAIIPEKTAKARKLGSFRPVSNTKRSRRALLSSAIKFRSNCKLLQSSIILYTSKNNNSLRARRATRSLNWQSDQLRGNRYDVKGHYQPPTTSINRLVDWFQDHDHQVGYTFYFWVRDNDENLAGVRIIKT